MITWTDRTVEMLVRLDVPRHVIAVYQAAPCTATLTLALDRRRR